MRIIAGFAKGKDVMENNMRLPKIFGEGCVLQQGENTRIWGWGAPGEMVTIRLKSRDEEEPRQTEKMEKVQEPDRIQEPGENGNSWSDTAICVQERCEKDGRFETCFPHLAAGGPYVLEAAGENGQVCRVQNVYVGEVFVCAGQSNMELPMCRVRVRFPEEFAAGGASSGSDKKSAAGGALPENDSEGSADFARRPSANDFVLHIYKVTEHYDFDAPLDDHVQASWQAAVRENLEELSAFSYFFGKEIALFRGVPVGILNLSLGGTPAEAWTSREGLRDKPEYLRITEQFRDKNFCKNLLAKKERQEQNWYDTLRRQEELSEGQDGASSAEGQTEPLPGRDAALPAGGRTGLPEGQSAFLPERQPDKQWHQITLPCEFKDTELGHFCGSLLLRKKFRISEQQAGRAGVLRFGTLVDSDEMFLNGVKIGETGYQYPPRRYPVPEGLLREGENTLEIRLICRYGNGRVTPGKALDIIWEDVCSDDWMPGQKEAGAMPGRTDAGTASQADASGRKAQPEDGRKLRQTTSEAEPGAAEGADLADSAPVALGGTWEYRILAACGPAPEQVFLNRTPTGLFNGMVAPCQPYTVSAVVWYQGESNDSHPGDYAQLLAGLIQDWRRGFRREDLPFVVVQLPNCGVDIAPGDAWPLIREAQLSAERLPYVAVTVNLDIGEDNDLHPLNKKAAAQRAALAVRSLVYQEPVHWQGPRLEAVSVWGSSLRLTFRTDGGQGTAGQTKSAAEILPITGKKAENASVPAGGRIALRECGACGQENPRLFELAGEDGIYYPAQAKISGNTVCLQSGQVKKPCAVRYAWDCAPGKRLLYDENGLCAAPFCIKLRIK
ncbi:Glycosyl hydrolases family 2, sugar binding domain [Marvinbryantia formatexigens]|nr:Glycosyl hydrolases family 2, sugar binding domain [Marvinbryantia formatexigens]